MESSQVSAPLSTPHELQNLGSVSPSLSPVSQSNVTVSQPHRLNSSTSRISFFERSLLSLDNKELKNESALITPEIHNGTEAIAGNTEPLTPAPGSSPNAKWGVGLQQPTLMISYFLVGVALALGHHLYYHWLNNQLSGNGERQSLALVIGNVLSVTVIMLLRSACGIAYTQYIWMVLRRKAVSVDSLNKLFSLLSNPMGIFSLELYRQSVLAIFVATIIWALALAGITPAATLSVVPVSHSNVSLTPMSTIDISEIDGSLFNNDGNIYSSGHTHYETIASQELILLARRTALDNSILSFPGPESFVNYSYGLSFYGPTLNCSEADSSLLPNFQVYKDECSKSGLTTSLSQSSQIVSFLGDPSSKLLLYSSFSPTIGGGFTVEGLAPSNNWDAIISTNYVSDNISNIAQQWIQTANRSIVCTLANASFTLGINSINGVQTVNQSVNIINAVPAPDNFPNVTITWTSYNSWFSALNNLLSGNITINYQMIQFMDDVSMAAGKLLEESTDIFGTGLVICSDLADTYWKNELGENNISAIPIPDFTGKPWMCRNQTIDRGIEDLANNFTISMLSMQSLRTFPKATVNVTTVIIRNAYEYNPLKLLLPYSIAALFTFLIMTLGLFSFYSNGISHDFSFSSIMSTTCHQQLCNLYDQDASKSTSLGEELETTKLTFGSITTKKESQSQKRIGLGLPGEVVPIDRNGDEKCRRAESLPS